MGEREESRVEIEARDGTPLAGTRFEPGTVTGPTTLVLPAMGVPRRFYHRFARHLAGRGHRVVSIDYRGVAGSRPERLRGFEATITDWATLDVAGLVDHVLDEHAPDRLVVAGHSVAGQFFGLVPNKAAIERVFTVASVKGYWRMWRGRSRAMLWAISHVVVPVVARAFGYLPAKVVGLGGEDLPAGAALEWARWIRNPDYVVDEDGRPPRAAFAAYEGPMRAISLADDWYAPPETVSALLGLYPNARTEHRIVDPADVGLDEIGHFGFFEPACRPLWDQTARWLEGSKLSSPG